MRLCREPDGGCPREGGSFYGIYIYGQSVDRPKMIVVTCTPHFLIQVHNQMRVEC